MYNRKNIYTLLYLIMATYTLTVKLPESVFQQLARIAQLTNQSLETIVAQSITSNLPPSADNTPLQMQTE